MIFNAVLALGDSLTYGARDEFGRSYPAELGKILSEHFKQEWVVVNEGVSRETSSDILRRAYKTIQEYPEAQYLLLLVGTNDTKSDYPLDLYADNMRQIIRIGRIFGKKIIIGSLPPIKGSEMPCFSSNRSNEKIIDFNIVITKLAEEYNLLLADFSGLGDYLIDGVHLNHAGYIAMAKTWFNKILEV